MSLVLACCAAPLRSQTSTASITGVVQDKDGAYIANATIHATQLDIGRVITVTTNKSGAYSIPSLVPGHYKIECIKPGFSRAEVADVELHTADSITMNLSLKIGSVDTEVTVTTYEQLLADSTPTLTATVPSVLIMELPLPDRSALEVATLIGGVQGDPQYEGGVQSEIPGIFTQPITPGASLSIGGGRPGTASQLVDGFDITLSAYPRAGITLSRTDVADITVQRGFQEVVYGRNGGGIVNQATRSGTSRYHGDLEWRHEEPFFEAYAYGSNTGGIAIRPAQHQNLFTILLSGPVPTWNDMRHGFTSSSSKTFFLVSYEPEWLTNNTYARARLLTPDEMAGRFGATAAVPSEDLNYGAEHIYYQFPPYATGFPYGNQTKPYVQVPNDDISAFMAQNQIAKWVYSYMPTPTSGSPYAYFFSPVGAYAADGNNAVDARGVAADDQRYNIRIDHEFSARDSAFARYSYVPVIGNRYDYLGPSSPANQIPTDTIKSKNAALQESHIFSSTVVNEVRVNYLLVERERLPPPASTTKDFGAANGLLPAVRGAGFPYFNLFAPVGSGGSSTDGGKSLDVNFAVGNNLTIQLGSHTLKAGGEFRALQLNRLDDSYLYGGEYDFNADETSPATGAGGSALASLELGLIHDYITATPQPYYYRWKYYAGYIQDTWKVAPNVTVTAGLRYQVETPRKEINNLQGRFDPLAAGTITNPVTNAVLPVTGGFVFSGQNGTSNGLWPTNYSNLEPRLGIVVAPTPHFSMRASYGLIHTPLTGQGNNVIPNISSASQEVGPNNGGSKNGGYALDFITNPVASIALTPTPHTGPLFNFASSAYLPVFSQSKAVPYAQIYSFAMNFRLPGNTEIEAVYTGNKGTHLYNTPNATNVPLLSTLLNGIQQHASFNSNVVNPYSNVTENSLQALNPYQQFYNNPINTALIRDAYSIYHGAYVEVVHRPTHGFTYFVSYTWSKSIDDASSGSTDFNVSDSFGFAKPQTPYSTPDQERSLSTFDLPSRFTAGYFVQLPFGRGRELNINNRYINAVAGGWSTSGTSTVQSGSPIWILLGTDAYFVSSPAGTPAGSINVAANGAALEYANLRPSFAPGVKVINPHWRQDPYGLTSTGGYLNRLAFVTPGSLNNPQIGNVPRTMGNARNPMTAYFDASLHKEVPTGSNRFHLLLMLDALNVLNHTNFYMNTSASPSNGRVVATALPSATPSATSPCATTSPNPSGLYETYSCSFGKLGQGAQYPGRNLRLGAELRF